jgi:hypothetical protein
MKRKKQGNYLSLRAFLIILTNDIGIEKKRH